jgi:ATP-dependent RNA helicase DeaD
VLAADDSEHFRVVVDSLSNEFDVVQVAMAAVKLYHQATAPDDEDETSSHPGSHESGIVTPAVGKPGPGAKLPDHPWRRPVPRASGDGPGPRLQPGEMVRIYIGAGKQAGVRPQDLVGAISNEAGIAGGLIGAIQITDRFSLVEVPAEVADQVIKALGKSNVRGKKVQVRREGR